MRNRLNNIKIKDTKITRHVMIKKFLPDYISWTHAAWLQSTVITLRASLISSYWLFPDSHRTRPINIKYLNSPKETVEEAGSRRQARIDLTYAVKYQVRVATDSQNNYEYTYK